jgi:hypothetical protein
MLTFPLRRKAPRRLHTAQEVLDLYGVDLLAMRALLPRTWRDWLRVPLRHEVRWQMHDAFLDLAAGTPTHFLLWFTLGALLTWDWGDVRAFGGMVCERVPGLFYIYNHLERRLAFVWHPVRVPRFVLALGLLWPPVLWLLFYR